MLKESQVGLGGREFFIQRGQRTWSELQMEG